MAKPKSLEEALELIAAHEKTIAQHEADHAEKDAIIASLRNKPAAAAKGVHGVFTHEKKKYRVTAKSFNYEKQVITAEQVCSNKELQAELIKAGVGFIQPE